MNRDTIYVVICTNMIVHRRLNRAFTEALNAFENLVVESGPLPGLPTYIGDPWQPESMRFVMTEHMLNRSLRMDDTQPQPSDQIMPALSDTPLMSHVNISVIGAVHAGKTAIIRALEKTLLAEGIPVDRIERYSMDGPNGDPVMTPEQERECVDRMQARKVMFLFHQPKRTSSCDAIMGRCGLKPKPRTEEL
jgi:hypothetical protein